MRKRVLSTIVLMVLARYSFAETRIGKHTEVVFATIQEGKGILAVQDDFVRCMSPFDRAARMKTGRDVSEKEYLAFAGKQVLAWTDPEKEKVAAVLKAVKPKLEAFPLPLPDKVFVIMTTGQEEGNVPYTRGDAVVFPKRFVSSPGKRLQQTVCHELFHIISRRNPGLREKCYKAIGFVKCNEVPFPKKLAPRKMTNPDAPWNNHYIRIQVDGNKRLGIPILFSRTERYDEGRGGEFFNYLQFQFLLVAPGKDGKTLTPMLESGEPMLAGFQQVTGFFEQVGMNTRYIIHPEEILADNFALLVLKNGAVRSPEIQAKLAEVLKKHGASSKEAVSGGLADRPFVKGGQFKDLILPMPIIDGLESEGIWGNDNVLPRDRDNGIEDNQWCYWGGNPIKGKDGRYHIAVCRWPERTGHHGWFKSEVAHCVSDNPFGPYKITGTIVKEGHNPEVLKLPDGKFALHLMNSNVYTADRMPGPWTRIGRMRLDSRGFAPSNRLGSNLTTEYRPDGSIVLMLKNGYVAISSAGILGPYKMVANHNYARATGYPEDPVIWRSRHQYHCIYNHAQDRKSAYMRSLDGIHWKNESGVPYDVSTTYYTDGTKNQWYKFERPKVLQDDLGRATHLSLAIMDVSKGADKGNDNHSSKNMVMPLVTEKVISIVNDAPITRTTKSMIVKISAEAGFNPQKDLDIDSLRFGSDSVVNHGGGCKYASSVPVGEDLLVYFEGEFGMTHHDFDFKLIGRTKTGELVIGYALLPGKSTTAASLIALPVRVMAVDGGKVLESAIENFGLEASKPQSVLVYENGKAGRKVIKTLQIAAIKPYESVKVSVPLGKGADGALEYEIVIPGTGHEYWRIVNHTDSEVAFSGSWAENPSPDKHCFMKSEKIGRTIGDTVTFTFHGTRARAYGRLGRQMGTFAVHLDGKYMETVRSNYAPSVHIKIYQTPLLPDGEHVLELKKVKADFNGEVAIDAFSYESERNLGSAQK